MCDIFNNTSDLTGKIVCDVPVNGNVFLGATGTSHTIFPVKSFALLNVSHTVRRRNYVPKAVHHTQFLCGKHLRKVS